MHKLNELKQGGHCQDDRDHHSSAARLDISFVCPLVKPNLHKEVFVFVGYFLPGSLRSNLPWPPLYDSSRLKERKELPQKQIYSSIINYNYMKVSHREIVGLACL
jgi:hypothetical protein